MDFHSFLESILFYTLAKIPGPPTIRGILELTSTLIGSLSQFVILFFIFLQAYELRHLIICCMALVNLVLVALYTFDWHLIGLDYIAFFASLHML